MSTLWVSQEAEICLSYIAQGAMSDALRAQELKDFVSPTAVILIRCPVELQKAFLEALYPAK